MSEWHSTKDAIPSSEPHLITGYCYGDATKGRWYAVAKFVGGEWYEDETGDKMIQPTHFATLMDPDKHE